MSYMWLFFGNVSVYSVIGLQHLDFND